MQTATRLAFNAYVAQVATLSGLDNSLTVVPGELKTFKCRKRQLQGYTRHKVSKRVRYMRMRKSSPSALGHQRRRRLPAQHSHKDFSSGCDHVEWKQGRPDIVCSPPFC